MPDTAIPPSPFDAEQQYLETQAASHARTFTECCFAMRLPHLVDLSDFEPTEDEARAMMMQFPKCIPSIAAKFASPEADPKQLERLLIHVYHPIGALLVAHGVLIVGSAANEYIRGRVQDPVFSPDLVPIATTENLNLVLPNEHLLTDIHFLAGQKQEVKKRSSPHVLQFIRDQRSAGLALG